MATTESQDPPAGDELRESSEARPSKSSKPAPRSNSGSEAESDQSSSSSSEEDSSEPPSPPPEPTSDGEDSNDDAASGRSSMTVTSHASSDTSFDLDSTVDVERKGPVSEEALARRYKKLQAKQKELLLWEGRRVERMISREKNVVLDAEDMERTFLSGILGRGELFKVVKEKERAGTPMSELHVRYDASSRLLEFQPRAPAGKGLGARLAVPEPAQSVSIDQVIAVLPGFVTQRQTRKTRKAEAGIAREEFFVPYADSRLGFTVLFGEDEAAAEKSFLKSKAAQTLSREWHLLAESEVAHSRWLSGLQMFCPQLESGKEGKKGKSKNANDAAIKDMVKLLALVRTYGEPDIPLFVRPPESAPVEAADARSEKTSTSSSGTRRRRSSTSGNSSSSSSLTSSSRSLKSRTTSDVKKP